MYLISAFWKQFCERTRKFQLVHAAKEVIVQWNRWSVFALFRAGFVLEVHEDTQPGPGEFCAA